MESSVAQLKAALASYGLPRGGVKEGLQARLQHHLEWRALVRTLDLDTLSVPDLTKLAKESGIAARWSGLRTRSQLLRFLQVMSTHAPLEPARKQARLFAVVWTHPITRAMSLYTVTPSRSAAERAADSARQNLAEIPFEAHLPVEIHPIGSEDEARSRWPAPPLGVEIERLQEMRNTAAYHRVRPSTFGSMMRGESAQIAGQQRAAEDAMRAYERFHGHGR